MKKYTQDNTVQENDLVLGKETKNPTVFLLKNNLISIN